MQPLSEHLEAHVTEFRPLCQHYIRVSLENCVNDLDMRLLQRAKPIERKCWVKWGDEVKTKQFTRLRIGRTFVLADRVTGTIFSEKTGKCSSDSLRLV
jgi:hypothetical protein